MTHLLIHSYSASYDRTTKVISLAVGVFLPGLGLYTGNPYLFVLGVFIVLGGYAYSPRRYSLDGRSIVIHRLAGNVSLPLEGLRRASPAAAEDLRGCIRLWGSGGLFGYYGLFRTSSLGRCTWYVTNRAKMVVVETSGKTVLVSPDDVDGFLAAVRGLAPATAQPAGAQGAPSGGARRGAGMTARLAGGAIALAGIAIVIFALLYAPGPPSYTLTERSLAIHDRLYPVTLDASAVDTAGVRFSISHMTRTGGPRPGPTVSPTRTTGRGGSAWPTVRRFACIARTARVWYSSRPRAAGRRCCWRRANPKG
jgi:hypothetical protein